MKMKKSVIGLLSAFLVVGGSASAFAASSGSGNSLDNISAKITEITADALGIQTAGKEKLIKDKKEQKNVSKENVTGTIKTFESGTMDTKVKGTPLNKEMVSDLSVDFKVLAPGKLSQDTKGKVQLNKQ
ncbi:hypothetical protein [Paenibacillus sp. UMB4589-SE434]|uniref:hypothetical protein n=1 Tax=Paenibacillus sp. UMB4589-SE434 TaxID=3046314 RepID=UPI00254F39AD|nr:hypothetical protein [Paenibacillus sp. UMB4589-SE434]MDK8179680.1 hypothetical protein [Paenibacillus sp. UMB4589-SE434]